MKAWVPKVILFIIVAAVIGFNVLIYAFCERQKAQMEQIVKQQQDAAQDNSKQFKYQQEQIQRLSKDLQDARQQAEVRAKDQQEALSVQKEDLTLQKEAMIQEIHKRQQLENENKSTQASLIDIKAEADAIKQQMKGWQKDYVSVLAQLTKNMDERQSEFKEDISSLKDEVEKITHPADNSASNSPSSAGSAPMDNSEISPGKP